MSTAGGQTRESRSARTTGSRNNPGQEAVLVFGERWGSESPATGIRAPDLGKRRLTWEATFRYHPRSRLRRMVGLAFTRQPRRLVARVAAPGPRARLSAARTWNNDEQRTSPGRDVI